MVTGRSPGISGAKAARCSTDCASLCARAPQSLDRFQKRAHIGGVSSTDYAEQLRSADLRVTRPRLAVLEAVNAHPHADTETIFSAVRIGLPDVSRQAVYDVLNALTAVGLVRRIQPSGLVARYESRVGDN